MKWKAIPGVVGCLVLLYIAVTYIFPAVDRVLP